MAIVIPLLGFNDLGLSVTPTFLFRNRFYLQLSSHCPKMNKKSMWEVKKNFKNSVDETWNPAMRTCSLIEEPHQLTKFA